MFVIGLGLNTIVDLGVQNKEWLCNQRKYHDSLYLRKVFNDLTCKNEEIIKLGIVFNNQYCCQI